MGKLASKIPVPTRREIFELVRAFIDVDSVHERDVVNLLDIREALGIRRHPAVGAVDWANAMGIRIHATRRPKYGSGTEVLVRLGEFADELQTSPKLRNSYRLSASKIGEPFPGTNYYDMIREGAVAPRPRGGQQTVEINAPVPVTPVTRAAPEQDYSRLCVPALPTPPTLDLDALLTHMARLETRVAQLAEQHARRLAGIEESLLALCRAWDVKPSTLADELDALMLGEEHDDE